MNKSYWTDFWWSIEKHCQYRSNDDAFMPEKVQSMKYFYHTNNGKCAATQKRYLFGISGLTFDHVPRKGIANKRIILCTKKLMRDQGE